MPIIETLEGEVSAYIPTNVISITDGQIYVQPDLFFSGVRPSDECGYLGFSRGWCCADQGDEESLPVVCVSTLAAFRALEAFAQLGTDLDAATQGPTGSRIPNGRTAEATSVLNRCLSPMQVISLYAGTKGYPGRCRNQVGVQEWERDLPSIHYITTSIPRYSLETSERIKAESDEVVIDQMESCHQRASRPVTSQAWKR